MQGQKTVEMLMGMVKFGKNDSEVKKPSEIVRKPTFIVEESVTSIQKPVFLIKDDCKVVEKPVFSVAEAKEKVIKPVFLVEEQVEVIKKPSFSIETVDTIMNAEIKLNKLEEEVRAQNKIMAIGFGLLSIINILILFAR